MTGGKYTKADLIEAIHEASGIGRGDVKTVFELVMQNIKDAISGGGTVELRGFGTFKVRVRKGRAGARNPRTGEPVAADAHGVPYWKPCKKLKSDVRPLSGEDVCRDDPQTDASDI
jgi:integration host factor subunit beta